MGSRMYEKATPNTITTPATPVPRVEIGANAGFWKKNTIAIPGRPNPSKVNASATFQDFEQSVSDVWDINEDDETATTRPPVGASILPGQLSTQQLSQLLLQQQQQQQQQQKTSPTKSSGTAVATTPIDVMVMHASRRPSELSTQLNQLSLKDGKCHRGIGRVAKVGLVWNFTKIPRQSLENSMRLFARK